MNRKKILTILKSVAIVLILVAFVFLLRGQAYNLSAIPVDQRSAFIDSSGLPYFSEMDSYYNLRLTQDFMDHGYFGDTIRNGTPWDLHSYSPEGRSAEYQPLIAYVTSFLYYIANLFDTMSIKEVAFWTGAIIASFAVIPAYIFVRRITNDYGGISAALLVSLAPNYFTHTYAGFFDTDMFNVLFPIFAILFFVESIRNDNLSYRIIFALLSLASLMIFSLAWVGYIFYVVLLVIFVIVYLILGLILKIDLIKPIKNYPNILSWFVNQKEIFSIVFMIVVGFVGLGLVEGFGNVINSITGLFGATQLQALAQSTSYPNVFISVAELQVPNLLVGGLPGAFLSNAGGVVNGVGGIIALFGALIILFLFAQRLWNLRSYTPVKKSKKPPKGKRKAISKSKRDKNKHSFIESTMGSLTKDKINKSKRETLLYLVLFSVWIVLSAIAVTQGSRFIQVLVLPIGLASGIFVGYAVMYIKNRIDKNRTLIIIAIIGAALVAYPIAMMINQGYGIISFLVISVFAAIMIYGVKNTSNSSLKKTAVMIIITLAIITPTVAGAYQSSQQVGPGTSDPMWNSMTWIKENTTKDTVITSWWDFGYLFEIAADRPVTFDGGSQNTPRAFWTGKAMTTSNESLSAGIFKMLATSGDKGYLLLDNYTNDTGTSVKILEKILGVPKEEAKSIMINEYDLTSTEADNVIKYSHPANPKPVIFVASSDMLQKAGWWTYFGNWDFDAGSSVAYQYLVSQMPGEMKKINGVSQANVTNLQEGSILYQTIITKGSENNTTNATFEARYENGSKVTYPNGTVFVPTFGNETVKINRLLIIEDTQLMKNETVDSDGGYTLLIFGDNGTYSSILMSKELENAMFTKLFILNGFGQNSFEQVHVENGVSLWKVK